MMEFYNNNGESGNLSLQDMIECDIRSSFGDQMTNSEGLNAHNHNLDNHIPTSMDFNVNGLGNVTANGTHLTQNSDSTKLQDLSWLQNVDVATIQQLVQPENTDPNLLVNPQTGMPIQQQQSVQNETSQSQVTVSLAQPQGHNQVHYVNIPSSPLRQVQTPQSFSPQRPQQQPSPMQHVQNLQQVAFQNSASQHVQQQQNNQLLTNNNQISHQEDNLSKVYPKPVYSYSCLIALALKNSETGCLPVSEIYQFMTENFPYFKTAPGGWKNSVRHNLSLNKCFEKIENPKSNGQTRKGCLWGMNPAKIEKMEEEIAKWRKKDPIAIKRSMSRPENLELYERAQPGSNSPKPPPVSQPQVIEITPHKPESITIKDEKIGNNLTSEELSMLDHSLNMDPALSEIALENGIWDDLNSDGLNLDDIPISTSPINFSFTSTQLRASPVSMQSNSHGASKLSLTGIQGNYLYADQSVVSASMTQSPTTGAYQVTRTVAATT